jgi:hypothetical protein
MHLTSSNPLSKHFRQPKLYIRLPSQGNFYAQGSLELTDTGEYPVFAMTAKDELMFKTPDALLNGQSTVSVIQSCIPNIKNAWNIPSIDIDAILIAIRIATYGEKMDIEVKIPGLKENNERGYEVDLRLVLDQLTNQTYENIINADGYKIEIEPMNYKKFTEIALKTFEEQRLFRIVNNDDLSETEKLEQFNQSFMRLTEMNINQVSNSVVAIQFDGETPVVNKDHILEFINNADKEIYKKIISHIDIQREKFQIKPIKVQTSEEEIANGAVKEFEVPITFDQSNFFA